MKTTAPIAPDLQPVAWSNNTKGFTANAELAEWWKQAGFSVTPLYAAPIAPAVEQEK